MIDMQADLFQASPPPEWSAYLAAQEALGQHMAESWQAGLDTLAEAGRIPNWMEIAEVLQRDELRLLRLIEDNFGYVERFDVVTKPAEGDLFGGVVQVEVPRITADSGFIAHANANATINRCLNNRWITRTVDEATGLNRLDLTKRGRWMLDIYERDEWFDND